MDNEKRYIAHNLRTLRRKKGISVGELAKSVKLLKSTISNIENEVTHQHQIDTIVILSQFFNVDVHDFIYKKF